MQLEQQETFTIHGPQLELFGEVESKLPQPARQQPVAALVLAAAMLLSVFGIGGAQLKGAYDVARSHYTATNQYNQGIQNDFAAQMDAAASYIRIAANTLGADHDAVRAAQDALDRWNAMSDADDPSLQYALNWAMYVAMDDLHIAANGRNDDRLSGLYASFVSAQATIERAGADYNAAARAYNQTASGFPAGLVATAWGVRALPLFAGGSSVVVTEPATR